MSEIFKKANEEFRRAAREYYKKSRDYKNLKSLGYTMAYVGNGNNKVSIRNEEQRLLHEMLNAYEARTNAVRVMNIIKYREKQIENGIQLVRKAKTELNINRLVNKARQLINGSALVLNKATREKFTKNLNNARVTAERNSTLELYKNIERKIALIRKAGPNANISRLVNNARSAVHYLPNKNTRNKYYKNINNARIMNRGVYGPSVWRRSLTAEQLARESRIKGQLKSASSWYNRRKQQGNRNLKKKNNSNWNLPNPGQM